MPRIKVNETEMTLVEHARRVAALEARTDRLQADLAAAREALAQARTELVEAAQGRTAYAAPAEPGEVGR